MALKDFPHNRDVDYKSLYKAKNITELSTTGVIATGVFKRWMTLPSGSIIYEGDGTTDPQGALTGNLGDAVFNGLNGKVYYCTANASTNWSMVGAGSITTSGFQVQYGNNSGGFTGNSSFTWDNANSRLNVPAIQNSGTIFFWIAGTNYFKVNAGTIQFVESTIDQSRTSTGAIPTDISSTSLDLNTRNLSNSATYSGRRMSTRTTNPAYFGEYLEWTGSHLGILRWRMSNGATTSHELFNYNSQDRKWTWNEAIPTPNVRDITASGGTSTVLKKETSVRIKGNNTETVNLPDATTTTDIIYTVYRADANTNTITMGVDTSGTILGAGTSFSGGAGNGYRYQSDGTNYITLP